ncbi:MAG: tetratricopeptide repeat protein [Spirochaetes bacterium]|nr:tetratricopeptide repeat protein [Spirochaetota bacterium]
MKRTVLIFTTLLIASACKEKESAKRNNPTAINQKIDALLKEAAAATDDNKKAALFGDASELLIDKGDLRQAMVAARQGEKANPTQKQCLTSIAEVQLTEGKIPEATATLKDVLQRHPTYGRAHFVEGNLAASRGDYTAALASYTKAEKEKFQDARLLINMGGVALKAKKTKDAAKIYERAITADPNYAEAYLGAGIAARKENKKAEARKYFEKYMALAPHSSEANRVKVWLKAL